MKDSLRVIFLVMIGLLTVSVPLSAHHGNASYGHAKQLTVKGTVTEWVWLNPHTLLKMEVKDEEGKVVNWVVEWSAPSSLINFGINKQTFKPGDEVIVDVAQAKNNQPVGEFRGRIVINGKEFKP